MNGHLIHQTSTCTLDYHVRGAMLQVQAFHKLHSKRKTIPELSQEAVAGTANRPLLFLEHRIPMPELFTVRRFTRVLEAGKYGCPY